MGPRKKFVLSTTVRWSGFEVMLFRYLGSITNRSMADELRTAIRAFARDLPEFHPEAFLDFVKREGSEVLSDEADLEQMRREAATFIAQCGSERPTKPQAVDRLSGALAVKPIRSCAADFD